jgi:hypothetical protein
VGIGDRDPLGSEWLSGFEHPAAGLGDREQSGGHVLILANQAGDLSAMRVDPVLAW